MQINDIVIMKEDKTRNQWQLARIVETHVDKDNYVRKVKIVVSSPLDSKGKRKGPLVVLERPVHKLILLVEGNNNSVE